jgi:prepilin peptidase CpaA
MQELDAQLASNLVLLVILIAAVILDFKYMKISNRLILIGMILALVFCVIYGRRIPDVLYVLWNISFPVIVLYLFYLMGAIGAGDVKLFSVIGGFVNFKELVLCMICSFTIGAVISLGKMLICGTLWEGLHNGSAYFKGLIRGEHRRYGHGSKEKRNQIHFSLSILLGFLAAKLYLFMV